MKRQITLLVFLFFEFLSTGYGKNILLPPINAEFLIMGLKHNESLISSGKGGFHSRLSSGGKITDEFTAAFAFDDHRTYYSYKSGPLTGCTALYNKKIHRKLYITVRPEDGQISYRIGYTKEEPMPPDEDPRNWGRCYWGIPLSKYLQDHKARIIGQERLKVGSEVIPCYVVRSEPFSKYERNLKFWIAPKDGFRCIQQERISTTRYGERLERKRFFYKAYEVNGQKAWFPQRGIYWMFKDRTDEKVSAKLEVEVMDFQPNVDISDLFRVDIDPETPVWDEKLSRLRPFKEIGWQP